MADHAQASPLSPARWCAAGALGGASIVGMLWAIIGRAPAVHPILEPHDRAVGAPAEQRAVLPPKTASSLPEADPVPESAPERAKQPFAAVLEQETAAEPADRFAPDTISNDATERININSATLAELQLLPRIGPTLGARIIEFRDREGPIRSLTHLMDVKGIGARTAERLEPYLRFE